MEELIGKKKGLMDYGHPRSRDYGRPNFPCKRITCIANQSEMCISPARCEIGEDGKCMGYITHNREK